MARIVIKESDLTTPIIAGNSSEVVYVPGFGTNNRNYLNASTAVGKGTPTLCRTVAEFNAYFGSIPAVFSQDQPYPENFSENSKNNAGVMFGANTVDPSYVYAKELINAGIPVLYERLNDLSTGSATDDISVEAFYDTMVGTADYDPLLNLNNINDFNIKYITTGGYPSFEYGYTIGTTATISNDTGAQGITDVNVDSNAFIQHVEARTGEYQFVYTALQLAAAKDNSSTFSGTVTIDQEQFLSVQGKEGTYTFVASVSRGGSSDSTTWSLNGLEVSMNDYGISYTGTVVDGNTIVVTVSVTSAGWVIGGQVVENLANIGLTVTGTPAIGDTITVVVSSADNTSIVAKMLFVAATRGDCVALIDHTNNPKRSLIAGNQTSVYYAVSDAESPYKIASNGSFGAMFTPWYVPAYITSSKPSTNAMINGTSASNIKWNPDAMPPSFAYLMSLADSVKNNPSWYSVAGVTRGVVPNLVQLNIATRLTNAIADSYQKDDEISINPITNIRPYGYTIWGNRTLKNNQSFGGLTATSFLNIRNMVSDIKKQAYVAAMSCLFEQNTDILWLNFKSIVEPVLEQMTSGYGINGYKVIREPSDNPTKIIATIRVYPVYAVESFEITVELSNDTVSVAEAVEIGEVDYSQYFSSGSGALQ